MNQEFIWGTAASSYQIEGVAGEDRKGLYIWDVCNRQPGMVSDNHNGDVACDRYHRYREDVVLVKGIGIRGYRFSISWSRISPEGTGRVSEEGLAFYDKLIDESISNGVKPYIALSHRDYPYELYQRGGWMNPGSVDWFVEYVKVVVRHFPDGVTCLIAFNEPQCFIRMGHVAGHHAPGLKNPLRDTFSMTHYVMMAHGKAVQAMRVAARQLILIRYAPTSTVCAPDSDKAEDIEVAGSLYFQYPEKPKEWSWNVSWQNNPVIFGRYPEDGIRQYAPYSPDIRPESLALVSQSVDFYGQNIYNGYQVRQDGGGKPECTKRNPGHDKTAVGRSATPENLYWGPRFLYERCQKPICITENGMACYDMIGRDGHIRDTSRIGFTEAYIQKLLRAREDGADIRGYFCWLLMDNFEWTEGCRERFGLIYADYQTQKWILKDSMYWYCERIQNHR